MKVTKHGICATDLYWSDCQTREVNRFLSCLLLKSSRSGCYVSFSLSMSPFLQVYLQYTSEYMKGPMYWHPDKMSLGCGSFGCRIQLFIEEGCLI